MKHIDIYTDGACSGNPGVGGWAAILRYAGVEKVLVGREEFTTNNRMELTAVIEALKALREPCDVVVTTDSKYVVDAVNLNWLENWKSKGWRKSNNKQLPNIELWKQFDALLSVHNVKFKWIKGHAGVPENERCDALAVLQYSK